MIPTTKARKENGHPTPFRKPGLIHGGSTIRMWASATGRKSPMFRNLEVRLLESWSHKFQEMAIDAPKCLRFSGTHNCLSSLLVDSPRGAFYGSLELRSLKQKDSKGVHPSWCFFFLCILLGHCSAQNQCPTLAPAHLPKGPGNQRLLSGDIEKTRNVPRVAKCLTMV